MQLICTEVKIGSRTREMKNQSALKKEESRFVREGIKTWKHQKRKKRGGGGGGGVGGVGGGGGGGGFGGGGVWGGVGTPLQRNEASCSASSRRRLSPLE